MPFRNNNRRGSRAWDHVHAEACADSYRPPPLTSSSASSTRGRVATAASWVLSSITGKKRGAADSRDAVFMQKAGRLEHSAAQASEVLREYGGDMEAALKAMADRFLADVAITSDEEGHASPGRIPPDAQSTSSEEELPPQAALTQQLSSDAARAAVYDVFTTFIKPIRQWRCTKAQGQRQSRHQSAKGCDSEPSQCSTSEAVICCRGRAHAQVCEAGRERQKARWPVKVGVRS